MFSTKLSAVVVSLLASMSFAFQHDEATDGDLPEWESPAQYLGVATIGANVVTGTLSPRKFVEKTGDVFSFDIPNGLVVSSIFAACDDVGEYGWRLWINEYSIAHCNDDPNCIGQIFGDQHLPPACGVELLPAFAESFGVFTPPLGPGRYVFSGGSSTHILEYTLTFTAIESDVPASSSWGLLVLTLGTVTGGSLLIRRSQSTLTSAQ